MQVKADAGRWPGMVASEDGRRKQAFSPTLAGVLMEGACAARQVWMWRLGLAHQTIVLGWPGPGAGLGWPGRGWRVSRSAMYGYVAQQGDEATSQQASKPASTAGPGPDAGITGAFELQDGICHSIGWQIAN